jgi:hypothetical protein
VRGILQLKFQFTLAQHGGLIRRNQAGRFPELADTGRPTVEQTQPGGHDWQLRDAERVDDADDKKVAIRLLADFLADKRALEIRENSVWIHGYIKNGSRGGAEAT